MLHCVNVNHPDISKFVNAFGLSKEDIGSAIAVWQDENNAYDRFPTVKELEKEFVVQDDFDTNIDITKDVFVSQQPTPAVTFKSVRNNYFDGKSSKDASDILSDIASGQSPFSELASKLLPLAKKENLKVIFDAIPETEQLSNPNLYNTFGAYVAQTGEIYINPSYRYSSYNQISFEELVLHEVLHGITHKKLHDRKNIALKREFRALFKETKKALGDEAFDFFTGENSLDEFIVELFTNKDLIQRLNQVPYKNESVSLLDKIFDFIAQLFTSKRNKTLYDQAINVATKIAYSSSSDANLSNTVLFKRAKVLEKHNAIKDQEEQEYDLDINKELVEMITPVMKELTSMEMKALIVGGATRDALLGKSPKDIDIEVYNASMEELQSILEKYGKVDEVGKAFGILKFVPYRQGTNELVEIDEPFDFSIPRRENKVGKGYTGFKTEFSKDISIKEASSRRDFTWNTIGYDPVNKILYDYYGGVKDLREGVIKHTSGKFAEDPLRILRAMQFQSRMGHTIAPETADLIKGMIDEGMLDELPKERVVTEWLKWAVKGSNPQYIFDFLRQTGMGDRYFPELMKLKHTPQDAEFHPEGDVEEHTRQVLEKAVEIANREKLNEEEKAVLIFSALFHDVAKPPTTKTMYIEKMKRDVITSRGHEALGAKMLPDILNKMGITKSMSAKIIPLVKEHLAHATIAAIPSEKGQLSSFIKLIDRLEGANVNGLLMLMEADMLGRNNKNNPTPETITLFNNLIDKYKKLTGGNAKVKPLVTGKDVMALGFSQGKTLGNIVKAALNAQKNFEFETREEGLQWLGKHVKENNYKTEETEKPTVDVSVEGNNINVATNKGTEKLTVDGDKVSKSTSLNVTYEPIGESQTNGVTGDKDAGVYEDLLDILDQMGVSAVTLDSYREVTGNSLDDVNSLVDLTQGLVAIGEGRIADLPEELAHIVIEQQEGSRELDRALAFVHKTEEYRKYAAEYFEKYEGNERKVKKEILGKILGKTLFKQAERNKDFTLMGWLKKLLEKAKQFFRLNNEMQQYLNDLTEKTLSGKVKVKKGEGLYFALTPSQMASMDVESIDYMLNKVLQHLTDKNRVDKERKQIDKRQLKKKTETIKKIDKELEQNMYVEAVLNVIRIIRPEMRELLTYMDEVNNQTISVTSKELGKIRNFLTYYAPLMKEIRFLINEGLVITPGSLTGKPDSVYENKVKLAINNRLKYYDFLFNTLSDFERTENRKEVENILKVTAAKYLGVSITDPDIYNIIQRETGLNIKKEVRLADRDSSWLQTIAGSLTHASDNILNVMAFKMFELRTKALNKTNDFAQTYIRDAEDLGILNKSAEWAYEKTNGKKTGNFIDEYHYDSWEKAREEFNKNLLKNHNLPEDYYERKWYLENLREEKNNLVARAKELKLKNLKLSKAEEKRLLDLDTKLKNIGNAYSNWYSQNTREKKDAKNIIKKRKSQLNPKQFAEWYDDNTYETYEYDRKKRKLVKVTKFRGELVTPSDTYLNPEYKKLTDNQKKFLEKTKELMRDLNFKLGENKTTRAPQITANILDFVYHNAPEKLQKIRKRIAEGFEILNEDSETFGVSSIYRTDGSVQRFLPKRFTQKLKDTDSISTDMVSAVIAYYHMAQEYFEFSQNVDAFESVLTQIGRRDVVDNRKKMTGDKSKTYQQLDTFLEMYMFGQRSKDFKIAGVPFAKAIKNVAAWARNTNLAWNLFSSASGYFQAKSRTYVEGFIGTHFTMKEYKNANIEFLKKHYTTIMLESAKGVKRDKLGIFLMQSEVWDHKGIFSNLDKKRLVKASVQSGLYWNFEQADLFVKGPVVIAALKNMKIDSLGYVFSSEQLRKKGIDPESLPSVWDSTTVTPDGKLEIKYTNKNNQVVEISDFQKVKMYGRIQHISNNLDGKLSPLDYAAIHQHAVSALLTTHRGWLIDGIQKRFKDEHYNWMLGEKEIGYYRLLGRILRDTYLNKQKVSYLKELLARFNTLSEVEKRAVKRAIYEMLMAVGVVMIAIAINALEADDDDDTWYLQYMAYLSNRVFLEVGSFVPPSGIYEISETIQNPLLLMAKLELLLDFGDFVNMEEVESGPYKGYTKSQRAMARLTPIVSAVMRLNDVSKANQFLKNKSLRWLY